MLQDLRNNWIKKQELDLVYASISLIQTEFTILADVQKIPCMSHASEAQVLRCRFQRLYLEK